MVRYRKDGGYDLRTKEGRQAKEMEGCMQGCFIAIAGLWGCLGKIIKIFFIIAFFPIAIPIILIKKSRE
jgi:hypothetical protein